MPMRWSPLLLCAFLFLPPTLRSEDVPQKNVLLLYGQRAELPGLQLVGESIRKTLDREPKMLINVFTEHLDFARFPRAQHDADLHNYLQKRYADRRIDLVIPIFGPALEFTLDHRKTLFPDQPIVFCFVDEREAPMASLPPDVTGVYLHYDFERTLKLATTLQPDAKEIVLVAGTSEFDRYWAEKARQVAEAYSGQIPNRTLTGSAEELVEATRSLARNTIVLYISVYRDAAGHDVIPVDLAAYLAATSNAPVYGTRSNWIDRGVLGGAVFEHATHGRTTGQLALAALKGSTGSPSQAERLPSPLVVNWRALQKWGIPPDRVPVEAEQRFRPPPFWKQHRTTALIFLGVLLLQCGLIAALLIHRARLRKSEQALDNRLEFETQIANAAADLIDLPPDQVDQKVEQLLREAIDAAKLDRSILFEYRQDKDIWRITHSVSSDGKAPVLREIPYAEAPWLHDKMKNGEALVINDVEKDLPLDARADRELLRQRGVRSTVVFPISFSREAIRGIAFHATRRKLTWPQDQLSRLRLVGEIVHSALLAKRSDEALRASEERYREVVESQTDLVCRYLPDSTLTFVNEAYCRCFNRNRDQLIGTKFLELIPEPAREATRRKISSFGPETRELSYEHEVILPNGEIGWQQWTDYIFLDSTGKVVECQAIGRDITIRKRAELSLLESEARIKLATDAVSLGFWDWYPAAKDLWLSAKTRSLLGFEENEPITFASLLQRVVPEDRVFVENAIEHARLGQDELNIEYRIQLADQRVRWIRAQGRNQERENSDSRRIIGICMDITAHKQAEFRFQAQLAEMSHVSRLAVVGELTASIAHEVNQPLAAMLSNAETIEILLNAPTPALDTIREILADIRSDNDRASSVIRRLRGLLRKHSLEAVPLHTNSLILDTVRFISFDARRRSVEIRTDLTPGLPPIRGDKLHLQQVLLNLIINGMDAMSEVPESNRRITVKSGETVDGAVSISIYDRGPGIPEEGFPKLFDSFFTTKKSGVGLGLSISRSIVEAHHGRIWAENLPGGGAAFHVSLRADRGTNAT